MTTKPHILYGMPCSLYTARARSYLRQQNIPFVEVSGNSAHFRNAIVPKVGRWIIPVLETSDGDLIQDGSEIMAYFERRSGGSMSATPTTPRHHVITRLFELFGSEALLRPAMYYRWHFDEQNLPFLQDEFTLGLPGQMDAESRKQAFAKSSGRMRKAGMFFGVSNETASLIEDAYHDFLSKLNAHFQTSPYLLGNRATLGDFGLAGPLYGHLARDPFPSSEMKTLAPDVYRWTERMNASDPHATPEGQLDQALFANDEIPETLKELMTFFSEEYLPEISAHIAFANEWLSERPDLRAGTNGLDDPASRGIGMAQFEWRGTTISSVVMPYRFYLLQKAQTAYDKLDDADRTAVDDILEETSLKPMMSLRTIRPVIRVNQLEAWGEPV